MLKHQFYHRAKKVPISDQELRAMKNKKSKKSNDTDKDEKKKTDKKKKDKKDDESEETSKDDKIDDDKIKSTEVRLYFSWYLTRTYHNIWFESVIFYQVV